MKKRSLEKPDASSEVGYRQPPKASRFQKGRSGNPRGRPPDEENLIGVFKRLASKRIKIKEGEKWRTITMADAVILQNYKAALQKDQSAMNNILRLAEECGELVDRSDPKQVGRPAILPIKSKNMHEFLAEFGRTPETE
jgi:predicted DNA-binding antitoxin AbrB/MazE fold protein